MRVETDETTFRIVADDGIASELAVYGTAAMLDHDGSRYYCWIDDPDETPQIRRIDSETDIVTEQEDTEFEIESVDEEEEEEEEEEDDGGEPVEVIG